MSVGAGQFISFCRVLAGVHGIPDLRQPNDLVFDVAVGSSVLVGNEF